jgi:hypothetical protein
MGLWSPIRIAAGDVDLAERLVVGVLKVWGKVLERRVKGIGA